MSDPSSDRYRQIVEGTAYGVIAADEHGHITVWNRGAGLLLGYAASDAIGQPLNLVIPEAFRARHGACYAMAMSQSVGRSRERESTIPALHRDGSTVEVRGNLTILQGPEGRVTGASLIMRRTQE